MAHPRSQGEWESQPQAALPSSGALVIVLCLNPGGEPLVGGPGRAGLLPPVMAVDGVVSSQLPCPDHAGHSRVFALGNWRSLSFCLPCRTLVQGLLHSTLLVLEDTKVTWWTPQFRTGHLSISCLPCKCGHVGPAAGGPAPLPTQELAGAGGSGAAGPSQAGHQLWAPPWLSPPSAQGIARGCGVRPGLRNSHLAQV